MRVWFGASPGPPHRHSVFSGEKHSSSDLFQVQGRGTALSEEQLFMQILFKASFFIFIFSSEIVD